MVGTRSESEILAGVLLGTAMGDALGLPCEGMRPEAIRRRFGRVDRFRLLGSTGFVSDDTEQSALLAEALARHPSDPVACAHTFSRLLLGWFCRIPWGIGMATVRASIRIALGLKPSGVRSAGNGAAMRAALVGAFFREREPERRTHGRALAEVTHRDARAVEGALFVAEVTAALANGWPPTEAVRMARCVLSAPLLLQVVERAGALAGAGAANSEAASELGTSGYIVHTLGFATFCLLRFGEQPMNALSEAISAGGDTDSIGAILGAWLGAMHGEFALELVARIHDGPFGPAHLRHLAKCLARAQSGDPVPPRRFSRAAALVRNGLLLPVVLGHGFRRLGPW